MVRPGTVIVFGMSADDRTEGASVLVQLRKPSSSAVNADNAASALADWIRAAVATQHRLAAAAVSILAADALRKTLRDKLRHLATEQLWIERQLPLLWSVDYEARVLRCC